MPARKVRPVPIDRSAVEAMVAEAVAAERARSERAMAGLLEAVGSVSAKLDMVADALGDAGRTLDVHAGLIRPMAEAFAAATDMGEADAAGAGTMN